MDERNKNCGRTLALKLQSGDNVAVLLSDISGGETAWIGSQKVSALEDIPAGHKIALCGMPEGATVRKYGAEIAKTTQDIKKGAWVHSHNLESALKESVSYRYSPVTARPEKARGGAGVFSGYRRKDGRVGTRNDVWILPTVGCVNGVCRTVERLSRERFSLGFCDGVFAFSHPYGCSQLGEDLDSTRRILSALMTNPNAGGVLLTGLGCENNQVRDVLDSALPFEEERVRSMAAQTVGDEIEEGVKAVGELLEVVQRDRREECPVSDLALGMKCGGSDAFSGITGNPLLGSIGDMVTAAGGRVLLGEVPEMFGAERQLMNRARDRETFERMVSLIDGFKEYFMRHGRQIYENPSPGNRQGGITTLEEKSLGAVTKGGSASITQVVGYGERMTERGLALVNTPGNDGVSSTALVAAGANLLLFTTGRGTPMGFPVPTVKISSNTELFKRKPHWIDFDAGSIARGKSTIGGLAGGLLDYLLNVASGKVKAKNELSGRREIAIWKGGVTL